MLPRVQPSEQQAVLQDQRQQPRKDDRGEADAGVEQVGQLPNQRAQHHLRLGRGEAFAFQQGSVVAVGQRAVDRRDVLLDLAVGHAVGGIAEVRDHQRLAAQQSLLEVQRDHDDRVQLAPGQVALGLRQAVVADHGDLRRRIEQPDQLARHVAVILVDHRHRQVEGGVVHVRQRGDAHRGHDHQPHRLGQHGLQGFPEDLQVVLHIGLRSRRLRRRILAIM